MTPDFIVVQNLQENLKTVAYICFNVRISPFELVIPEFAIKQNVSPNHKDCFMKSRQEPTTTHKLTQKLNGKRNDNEMSLVQYKPFITAKVVNMRKERKK